MSAADLTKREMFAAMAMQGLVANPGGPIQRSELSGWAYCNCEAKHVAAVSVEIADALLRTLSEGGAT